MKSPGSSFPCPSCGGGSSVKDSRPSGGGIRRRRVCLSCSHRWSTWETVMASFDLSQSVRALVTAIAVAESALERVRLDLEALRGDDDVRETGGSMELPEHGQMRGQPRAQDGGR